MNRRVSEMLLASVIAARATSYLFSKLILEGMGLFNLMAVRFLIAFALLSALFFRRLRRMDRRTLFGGMVMGALYFLTMTAELSGLKRVPSSTVSFLENTAIVWVPLLSAALARRAPERKTVLSAALCLAGVGLLTLSSAFGFGAGEAFCLAAALLYASAILVTDRLTHGKMDALAAGVVQVGTIGALGLVSALLFETPRLPQGGTEWLGILALAVVCTGFGFTLQPVAQRGTTAERTGLFCAVNPMVAAALGAVFLQETLSLQSLAGMGLILLGILVTGVRLPAPSRRKALATAPALGYNEEKTGNCR